MDRISNRLRARRRVGRLLAAWMCAGVLTLAPLPVRAGVKPNQVDAAIDKAVAFLLAQQQKDGSWEVAPKLAPGGAVNIAWGGETAIVTYALLTAGENPSDPAYEESHRLAYRRGSARHICRRIARASVEPVSGPL